MLMEVLQEQVKLQRIAKLVGPDALPAHQRLTLLVADIIKNAFLQQNSFDEVDMYCSPEKQTWMMGLLAMFITRARALIRAEKASLEDIGGMDGLVSLQRMKSEIRNDDSNAMDALTSRIAAALDKLENK